MRNAILPFCFLAIASFPAQSLEITSTDIQEGSRMNKQYEFDGFGCKGTNISPSLAWSNPPAGTKSYALTAFDPDAPTESGFWQWVVIDIPVEVKGLEKGISGKLKTGIERLNDYGTVGYGGPCPPVAGGMHRYEFTIWALPSEKLGIPANASNAVVGFMLNTTALDKKTLTATYVR